MQFVSIFLFAIFSSYSLVLAAPVNQTNVDSLQAKQQKATEIAGRLLKQMAEEQNAKTQIESIKEKNSEEHEEEGFGYYPSIDDLLDDLQSRYEPENDDRYKPLFDFEEEPSAEIELDDDDEEFFPENYQFFNQHWSEQDESDENVKPIVHTPVLDDTVMKAEEHQKQQRRRRRSY